MAMKQETTSMRLARRKLTIMDGILLLAAIGVGLAIARQHHRAVVELPSWHRGMSFMEVWYWTYHKSCVLQISSMPLSMMLLILRLRQPRPRFKRLMRQPGTVACWAVFFVVGLRILGVLEGALLARIVGVRWHEMVFDWPWVDEFGWDALPLVVFTWAQDLAPQMCLAVAVTWSLLAVSGQWHPEPSWIDRMGRVIGIYYILMIPFFVWIFPFSIDYR
jgi:hypothetical protein